MDDAVAGGHPVHVTRGNALHETQTVAMYQRAFEQIGYGGQSDMRVRPYIDRLARIETHGAHVIKKNERADVAPRCGR